MWERKDYDKESTYVGRSEILPANTLYVSDDITYSSLNLNHDIDLTTKVAAPPVLTHNGDPYT